MILGATSDPTANDPVPFTPPAAARPGFMPGLPSTGWYSRNFQPFAQVRTPMRAFPAYRPPLNPHAGPQQLPSIQAAAPAAPAAPAPGPTPAGTNGAFGGSGFGSSGGVQRHMHVDPYNVMRSGNIPGVSPNGSNIRSGYLNAGRRVQNSMPFQQPAMYPVMIPSPPPPPAPMPMPAATHGFGDGGDGTLGGWFRNMFSWHSPSHAAAASANPHPMNPPTSWRGFGRHPWAHTRSMHPQAAAYSAGPAAMSNCEWVGPRTDGMFVQICNGTVMAMRDQNGNVQDYPHNY